MAVRSSPCCSWSFPSARGPQPSLGTPSPSLPLAATLLPNAAPAGSLRGVAAAGPKWRLDPLPGTPRRPSGGARACASSPETEGSPPPNPVLLNRIFVKGLPHSTSERALAKTFSQFGHVTRVKIITSKATKQSLGLAYVWFASEEDAQLAVEEMNGKFVDGRFVHVAIAAPEAPTRHVRATPYRF